MSYLARASALLNVHTSLVCPSKSRPRSGLQSSPDVIFSRDGPRQERTHDAWQFVGEVTTCAVALGTINDLERNGISLDCVHHRRVDGADGGCDDHTAFSEEIARNADRRPDNSRPPRSV